MLDESDGLLNGLTPAQREAVRHHGGPLLIIAGPGSGKTEVISRRAAYLITSGTAKPENLLVTTFTEKAALELKDRIHNKLKDARVELMRVSTIHSFCKFLLTEFRDESDFPKGFRILDEAAQLLFIYSRRKDLGLGEILKGRESDFFADVIRVYNLASEELVKTGKLEDYCEKKLAKADDKDKALWEERLTVAKSYGRYLELLQNLNVTDFSNLQRHTLEMLQKKPLVLRQVQSCYTNLLVDEYQDTNSVQEMILRLIAASHGNLAVVGDDDQSIYRFRGATVKNILSFEDNYKSVKIVRLEDNFRSLKPIVDHCFRLISKNAARMYKKLCCYRNKSRNDILVVHEKTADQEAKSVVSLLAFLFSKGIIKQYRDVAILLRSVKSYGSPYLNELRENEIPHIVTRDGQFFDREDISDLYNLFVFLSATKPWGDKFARCSVMGLSEEAAKGLQSFKDDLNTVKDENKLKNAGLSNEKDRQKIIDLIELKRHVQGGQHQSILEVLFRLLRISGYFEKIEKEENTEAIRNIGILSKIVSDFDEYRGTKVLYPFLSYMKMLKESSLDSFRKSPEDAVQVMTVHQAKGLEFPVVIIGAAMEGRFPTRYRRDKYEIPYSLTKSGKPEVADHHTADERKLFYVAATRARDLLIIGTSDVVNKRGEGRSRFIEELLGVNYEGALKRSRMILESMESAVKIEGLQGKSLEPRMRLSYSQIAYYLQCPLRFRYFEVDHIHTPRPYYLHFGTSVHRALELLHRDVVAGRSVEEEDLERYLERAWIPFLHIKEEDERALKRAAMKQLADYLRNRKKIFPLIESAEQHFIFHMGDSLISGKIDLIRKASGRNKEIVDFKTSESKTAWKEQIDLQMSMYALGAEDSLGLQVERCSTHFLKDDKVLSSDWDGNKKKTAVEYLKNLINQIKLQRFVPRQEYCPFCGEFKHICPYYEGGQ